MPNLNLSDHEIDQLIAFLDWVGHIDTRMAAAADPRVGRNDPRHRNGGCGSARSRRRRTNRWRSVRRSSTPRLPVVSPATPSRPGVNLVGPSLADIAATAARRIADPSYHGTAKDAAGYIRESIMNPNAFVVEGPTYSSGGHSLMPTGFDTALTPRQIDDLVAYLMTLK